MDKKLLENLLQNVEGKDDIINQISLIRKGSKQT